MEISEVKILFHINHINSQCGRENIPAIGS